MNAESSSAPREIPERGKRFLAELPAHPQRYVDGYTSISTAWSGK